MVDLDQLLSRSVVVADVDQKIAAISQRTDLLAALPVTHAKRWNWTALALAMAAALLLALLPPMFGDQKTRGVVDGGPMMVARLIRATGSIQLLAPGTDDWTTVSAGAVESFAAGSRVKTSDGVLCELQTSADGLIRLNQSAELVLHLPNQVELVAGQLWCLAPSTNSIEVEIPVSHVEMTQLATMACPSSSEFQCTAGNDFASCNSVSPENPSAWMTLGAFNCPVAPGETVSVDSNQKVDRTTSRDSATKVWQLPLLAIGTSTDQELRSLLKSLLAPIGMTKAMHLNESQIRQLGPAGAIPLLAYAIAESSPKQLELRQTATRLAAELADRRSASMLEKLTSDPDAFIANQAKESLRRIFATSGQ